MATSRTYEERIEALEKKQEQLKAQKKLSKRKCVLRRGKLVLSTSLKWALRWSAFVRLPTWLLSAGIWNSTG